MLGLVTAHWGLVLTLLRPHLLPGPGGWTRSTSTTPGDPNTAQLTQRVTGTRPSSLDAGSKLPFEQQVLVNTNVVFDDDDDMPF